MNAILFTVSPARTKTHTECSSLRATIVELCKKCVKVYFAYRKLRLCLLVSLPAAPLDSYSMLVAKHCPDEKWLFQRGQKTFGDKNI